ncbi:hypothetical protein NHX12_004291 [Muraenolepis orangiensis]|uniref:Serine/threonine-protein phosphatase n=1 Tax=Muraenolepis orangiensis TaxID=630683 RepID=A0A9Q0IFE5_9TELE|nr:hypothetical protein NHX12_004291 [Muraenolepis orangiensis]
MGCGTSIATEPQSKAAGTDEAARNPSPALTMKAAILIQGWYRRYMARLEMRRRYTWNIFQSIEYAGEQDQLQLSGFFSFMLDNFTHLNSSGPDLISQLLVDPWLGRDTCHQLIPVAESYSGPRISFPLSVSHTDALLTAFKEHQILHASYALQLLWETKKLLKQMPNIVHMSTSYAKEITICGDLHGHLDDLLLIFYKNGLPSADTPYVFNGDFVDRGKQSMEVVLLLFAYLLLYPNHMHLNRGNHEDHIMNLRYGFTKEVMQKYKTHGRELLQLFQDVFSLLPVATVIDSKVLVVHGGISDQTDLDFLNSIERHKVKSALRLPRHSVQQLDVSRPYKQTTSSLRSADSHCHRWLRPVLLIVDVLWSDPKPQEGCSPNTFRGGGCYYGPDVTRRLLLHHGYQLLIRSHECKQEGYEICHGGHVITIFSASNYYEEGIPGQQNHPQAHPNPESESSRRLSSQSSPGEVVLSPL